MAPPGRVIFWLIITTIFWGGSFVFNKIGFRDIPPVTFMFFRFALATMVMGVFCFTRLSNLTWEIVRKGLIIGVVLAATNLTFVIGVYGTTVTRAGFLNNLFVLLIPILSFLVWRERVDRWNLVGIILALLGIVALAHGGVHGVSRGDLISTFCALFISVHIIVVSKLLRDEDVYLVSLIQFATVALVGGILYLILPLPAFHLSAIALGALGYCVIFPTIICFTLQNNFQRHTTPTQAGLIYTLDPVWSMLGGAIVLGERLRYQEWLGCGLIFGAVLVPLIAKYLRERNSNDENVFIVEP